MNGQGLLDGRMLYIAKRRHSAISDAMISLGKRRSVNKFDTAGESFELNTSAAQRVGMLTGTVRAIILAQGSVPDK